MSGQGRGRSQGKGCGGRQNYNNHFNRGKSGHDKKTNKKSLSDFNYHLGSSAQASNYKITTDYIINYIKKTYDNSKDIAHALTTLQPVNTDEWKPTLNVSVIPGNDDEAIARRDVENRQSRSNSKMI